MQASRGMALSLTRGAILRSARAPTMISLPSSVDRRGWDTALMDQLDRLTSNQLRALLLHNSELIAPLLDEYYRSMEEPK
ncbi:unnamed protein product [Soboliphyme baturini]|uniref:Uncharacterized protein n=1 Tax=Soboliphyme baturini TaxID=241478 RepID=A0A183IC45_9BILA|nr:unnamed protein product [Soboliphyme baturini]